MEIYGRKGTLVLTSNSVNIGPSKLILGIGKGAVAEIAPPTDYVLIPADMAAGPGRNVAQAYARFAGAMRSSRAVSHNFDAAITRHTLIDAMERSHVERTVIKLD